MLGNQPMTTKYRARLDRSRPSRSKAVEVAELDKPFYSLLQESHNALMEISGAK
jgi:hypothetical protein